MEILNLTIDDQSETDTKFTELTHASLLRQMRYDPNTGEFWRISSESPRFRNSLPMLAKSVVSAKGYRQLMVDKVRKPVHVLAFFYMTGKFPNSGMVIDHIDGNPLNNKWDNLREVSGGENIRNQKLRKDTKSGHTGVYQRTNGKFMPHLRVDGKLKTFGCYETLEEALAVRKSELANYLNSTNLGLDNQQLKDYK